MKTKFLLLDYENTHSFSSADLSVLKEGEFMVKLFLGIQNKHIGVDLVAAMLPIASRVELIRLKVGGKNALDNLIAFYIGKLWMHNPESTFYIISKDTDYDALIKNVNPIGADVHRRKCIADIQEGDAALSSMHECIATAIASLRRLPIGHRPATQKKLRNVVEQLFKKELSEEQLLELIGALSTSGVIQIAGNRVSYNLPAPG